jgi:hypothetical protein
VGRVGASLTTLERRGRLSWRFAARHLGPEFPEIVRLTDLEPMISARYRIDREATAAALAKAPALVEELRRRGVEQFDAEPDR